MAIKRRQNKLQDLAASGIITNRISGSIPFGLIGKFFFKSMGVFENPYVSVLRAGGSAALRGNKKDLVRPGTRADGQR